MATLRHTSIPSARISIEFSVSSEAGSRHLPLRCFVRLGAVSPSSRGSHSLTPLLLPSSGSRESPAHRGSRLVVMASAEGAPTETPPPSITFIPATQAKTLVDAGTHTYLDVRVPVDYEKGHAVGAVNVPFLFRGPEGLYPNEDFLKQVEEKFPSKSGLVVACRGGGRSKSATAALVQAGYREVFNIDGGLLAWIEQGFPTTEEAAKES